MLQNILILQIIFLCHRHGKGCYGISDQTLLKIFKFLGRVGSKTPWKKLGTFCKHFYAKKKR